MIKFSTLYEFYSFSLSIHQESFHWNSYFGIKWTMAWKDLMHKISKYNRESYLGPLLIRVERLKNIKNPWNTKIYLDCCLLHWYYTRSNHKIACKRNRWTIRPYILDFICVNLQNKLAPVCECYCCCLNITQNLLAIYKTWFVNRHRLHYSLPFTGNKVLKFLYGTGKHKIPTKP